MKKLPSILVNQGAVFAKSTGPRMKGKRSSTRCIVQYDRQKSELCQTVGEVDRSCPKCEGNGVLEAKEDCRTCDGTGKLSESYEKDITPPSAD